MLSEEQQTMLLVAFEAVGPVRIGRAIKKAFPFVLFDDRQNPCACFVGYAGSAENPTTGWSLMRYRFDEESALFHHAYEDGDHADLRQLAVAWLAA